MKQILSLLFLFAACCFLQLHAQDVTNGNPGMWPSYINFKNTAPVFSRGSITMIDANGSRQSLTNGIIRQSEKDNRDFEHVRYQQQLNGIPIEHAVLLQHVKNGKVIRQNGKWIKDFPANISVNAGISETAAFDFALQKVGAQQYKWQLPNEESFLKQEQKNTDATFYPKAKLVYYSGESEVIPSALKLAYAFDIYSQKPLGRQIVFVDANNGNILGTRQLLHETDVPNSTAQTVYSGTQTITTDNTGINYRLRESSHGNGNVSINTYNLQHSSMYGSAVDFTDADNIWNTVNPNKDEYATDAHWATEKTYDYYYQKFNRNSIDGNGMTLNSYVHYSIDYFNAFWDGSRMTYGDGDAAHGNKPLTAIDVCGHEITHGVTERTSALAYSYESGAMNEGFSDIFGTAIEAFARPSNHDWLIGGDFYTIRSMNNPNAYNQPDTYNGTYWYTGSSDNGGVHTNSGVLNYWFYLLTTGGSGINDHGTPYNVTGIGMDKAAAIAYSLNTDYLLSTSDYYDARVLGIAAAENLYGIGSNEAIQTANAWTAVGLYAPSCNMVTGLGVTNILDRSVTLNWAAISGALNYKVYYKANTSATWVLAATVTVNTLNLSGLNASTLYDWKVRPDCNGQYTYDQFTTAVPICNSPGNLSASVLSNTSVILNWHAAFYAVNYDIEYKLSTDIGWTAAGSANGTTYTLTGLLANSMYDWRIKTNCSFGASSYAQSQFTTSVPCGIPAGVLFTYANNVSTFTWDAVPGAVDYTIQISWAGSSWSSSYEAVTATNSFSLANLMQGGNFQFRVRTNCSTSVSNYSSTLLFTTPCSAPGGLTTTNITTSSATLNWVPAAGNNGNTAFAVSYRVANPNTSWISLGNTSASSINVSGLASGTLYEWRVKKVCSALNSNDVTAQFTTSGASCGMPAALISSNITTTQANVSWAAVNGAVTYSVQYKAATSGIWSASINTSQANLVLTGLNPATIYDWKVMTNCSTNGSIFAAAQFTTSIPVCNPPSGLASAAITNAQATVSWVAASGASSYLLQYKSVAATSWSANIATSATTYTLTGLSAATQYDWRVMTNCGQYASNYAAAQFTTIYANGCMVPAGLNSTAITNTSAILVWDAVSTANAYTMQYRKLNTTGWNVIGGINTNSYALNSLLIGTGYEFQVKSKCGNTLTAYSSSSTFTTLNCVSNGINNAEWIDLFSIGAITRVSGADAGGYANTGLSTDLEIGTTRYNGMISAGFSGAAKAQNFCIYIDLNRNGSYDESGERVYGAANINGSGNINFAFNVPASATPGITGMRVVMRNKNNGTVGPCLTGFLGETEDYVVNLVASSLNFGAASSIPVIAHEKNEIKTGITVSPNPSQGIFNITLPKTMQAAGYEILNANGMMIRKNNVTQAGNFTIDITGLPAGLYLAGIMDKSGVQHFYKLLKN